MSPPIKMFLRGFKAELPILIGVLPFGMINGVLALQAGLIHLQAQAMSAIVFAGSSQIVLSQLIRFGAPGLVMVLTVAIINLRHMLYSASLAPYFQRLRPVWKILLSYLLTDEAYAVTIVYFQELDRDLNARLSSVSLAGQVSSSESDSRHWFMFGAGLALWSCWQLSTLVGISLGEVVPQSWSLDFTLALTFIALVVPNLKDRASIIAALSAGAVAIYAFAVPYKLGLILAALVGIACGMLVEGRE
jgi:predicted branched-subunit amino acid permease